MHVDKILIVLKNLEHRGGRCFLQAEQKTGEDFKSEWRIGTSNFRLSTNIQNTLALNEVLIYIKVLES